MERALRQQVDVGQVVLHFDIVRQVRVELEQVDAVLDELHLDGEVVLRVVAQLVDLAVDLDGEVVDKGHAALVEAGRVELLQLVLLERLAHGEEHVVRVELRILDDHGVDVLVEGDSATRAHLVLAGQLVARLVDVRYDLHLLELGCVHSATLLVAHRRAVDEASQSGRLVALLLIARCRARACRRGSA